MTSTKGLRAYNLTKFVSKLLGPLFRISGTLPLSCLVLALSFFLLLCEFAIIFLIKPTNKDGFCTVEILKRGGFSAFFLFDLLVTGIKLKGIELCGII